MSDTPETIVEHAYDYIAEWYLQWVRNQESPRETYINKILDNVELSPSILELGCGPGLPTLKMLLDQGAHVVANDISAKQIGMAKIHCPGAKLITGDMATLSFEPEAFDGVVSFFTLFHLPRSGLRAMLMKIHDWLKPKGMFVLNLATIDEEEIHGEFLGHGMFWSSYGVNQNKMLLKDVGFELLEVELLETGDGKLEEDDPDYGVKFMWVAARKRVPQS